MSKQLFVSQDVTFIEFEPYYSASLFQGDNYNFENETQTPLSDPKPIPPHVPTSTPSMSDPSMSPHRFKKHGIYLRSNIQNKRPLTETMPILPPEENPNIDTNVENV